MDTIRSDSPTVSRAQILVGLVNFGNRSILYISVLCCIRIVDIVDILRPCLAIYFPEDILSEMPTWPLKGLCCTCLARYYFEGQPKAANILLVLERLRPP